MPEVIEGVTTRPFRDDDEEEVLRLLTVALGAGPAGERSPAFFRWKHLDNPFGRSYMVVAEAEGRIVGLRAFLRWRLRAGERLFAAVRAVDTATHPDHQGRGIFSMLTRQALEDLAGEAAFVFNTPNASSLPGYLKMGWLTVGQVPVRVQVRKPIRFLRSLGSFGGAVEAASVGQPPTVSAPSAAAGLEDADGLGELLETTSVDQRLSTPRDVSYLRWRYGAAPHLGYHSVRIERRGRLDGMAIFRVRRRGSSWECSIAELFTRHLDRATGKQLLTAVGRATRVDHLTCSFLKGSDPERAATLRGFVRSPKGPTLVVRPLADDLVPEPTALDSWRLSLGDLEVF